MEVDHHVLRCLVGAEAAEGCLRLGRRQAEIDSPADGLHRITHESPNQRDSIVSDLTQRYSSSIPEKSGNTFFVLLDTHGFEACGEAAQLRRLIGELIVTPPLSDPVDAAPDLDQQLGHALVPYRRTFEPMEGDLATQPSLKHVIVGAHGEAGVPFFFTDSPYHECGPRRGFRIPPGREEEGQGSGSLFFGKRFHLRFLCLEK